VTADPIGAWLAELRRLLRFDPLLAARVLREVTDHLEEAAAAAEHHGLPRGDARLRAVERFGPPGAFVAQLVFHDQTLRIASLAGAAASFLTGLTIAGMVAFVLPAGNADQIPFWTLVAFAFLGYALLTAVYLLRGVRAALSFAAALASLAGLAGGLGAVADSLYRAWATGDWEMYVTLFGLVLAGHAAVLGLQLYRCRAEWLPGTP
jgi:hypothetical protein